MDFISSNAADHEIISGHSTEMEIDPSGETQTIVVPVIREDWELHKETRQTGTVRVQRLVHNREEIIDDSLTSETVNIERIPMNQVVDGHPEVHTEDGVTVISVVKEFAIVTKQLRIVEEIRITRRKSEIPMQQVINLRSDEVTVERLPPGQTARTSDSPAETIEMTETLEQAVITRHARVVEEVSVTKETSERIETIKETLRHTEVAVEEIDPE